MDDEFDQVGRAIRLLGDGRNMNRRAFMRGFMLCGLAANMLLSGCESQPGQSELIDTVSPTPPPRLRAAFSHLGLNTAWVLRGSETAKFMGRLLRIDVVSYDGELSVDKQRRDLEEIAEQQW